MALLFFMSTYVYDFQVRNCGDDLETNSPTEAFTVNSTLNSCVLLY